MNNRPLGIIRRIFFSHKLYLIVRLLIGSVFVYAGFIKLIDPKAFARTISQFDIVPEFLLAPLAFGLPTLEIFAGLGLVFNIRGSLMVIFNLLFVFVLVLAYGIFHDMDIDCGCFGIEEIAAHNSLKIALFRDLFMIVTVCYLYVYRRVTDESGPNYLFGKK